MNNKKIVKREKKSTTCVITLMQQVSQKEFVFFCAILCTININCEKNREINILNQIMRLINMNLSKKHMIWTFALFCLLIFGHGYFLASAKNLFNFSIFIDTDSKSNTGKANYSRSLLCAKYFQTTICKSYTINPHYSRTYCT